MGFSASTDIDSLAINRSILPVEAFTMCLGDILHIRFLQSEANIVDKTHICEDSISK
jgi:hypothetical protein